MKKINMGLLHHKEQKEKTVKTKNGRIVTMQKVEKHGANENLQWKIISNESKEDYNTRKKGK